MDTERLLLDWLSKAPNERDFVHARLYRQAALIAQAKAELLLLLARLAEADRG